MKEKQFYIDRAESCLKGIEIIKAEITKYKSVKKRREMAEKYAQDIAILEKEYRVNRSAYDVLFFAYEYFSDDRNPDNDNNLIPKGAKLEDAPEVHRELCEMLDDIAWDNHSGKVCYSMPRGHAKSTFVSNVFPIHQCYFECATDGEIGIAHV